MILARFWCFVEIGMIMMKLIVMRVKIIHRFYGILKNLLSALVKQYKKIKEIILYD